MYYKACVTLTHMRYTPLISKMVGQAPLDFPDEEGLPLPTPEGSIFYDALCQSSTDPTTPLWHCILTNAFSA